MDWASDVPPKLTTLGRLKGLTKAGNAADGNVIEITSKDELDEIRTLWASLEDPSPLTALLCGDARSSMGALLTRMSLSRNRGSPKIEDVSLLQIGKLKGPWIPTSKPIKADSLPQVQRVTLRVAAPSCYRGPFLGPSCKQDTPTEAIKALAQLSGSPAADFCGGKWSREERNQLCQQVGYLRLKPPVAQKLAELSGAKGLFMCVLNPKSPKDDNRPFWVPRVEKENDETYHRRVLGLQATRKQGMLFRLGSGTNLGFLRLSSDDDTILAKNYVIQGIPKPWASEDIEDFLQKQQWSELSRFGFKGRSWFFRGKPPDTSPKQTSWKFDIEDEKRPWAIHIQLAVSGARPSFLIPLKGPKRISSKESDFEVVPQKPNAAGTAGDDANSNQSSEKAQRGRSRSPRREKSEEDVKEADSKPAAPESANHEQQAAASASAAASTSEAPAGKRLKSTHPCDPDEATNFHGWRHWNQGGDGDCFFRAASVFTGKSFETQPDPIRSRYDGAWLRTDAVQHAKKRQQKFTSLCDDKDSYNRWITAAADAQTWVDGRLLQAVTEKTGRPVVVWAWKDNCWTRMVLASRFSGGYACINKNLPPICVVLVNKHYEALVPPVGGAIPTSWLRETASNVIDLTGGGSKAKSNQDFQSPPPSRRNMNVESTPSVHTLVSFSVPKSLNPSSDTPSVHTLQQSPVGNSESPCLRPPEAPPGSQGVSAAVSTAAVSDESLPSSSAAFDFNTLNAHMESAFKWLQTHESSHHPRGLLQTCLLLTSSLGRECSKRLETWDSIPAPTLAPTKGGKRHAERSATHQEPKRRRLTSKTSSAGVVERHQWACNLCDFKVTMTNRKSLYSKRSKHIHQVHRDQRQMAQKMASVLPIVEPTVLPASEQAWKCAHCCKALPYLPMSQMERSSRAHLKKCSGMTRAEK